MTITKTVEVPADRRIFLDLPPELPVGRAKVELSIIPDIAENMPEEKLAKPLFALFGIDRGRDTMDEYFARKRAGKAKEDAQIAIQLERSLRKSP
jgi:hypothetical protein